MTKNFGIGVYQAPGTYIFAGPPTAPPPAIQIIPGITSIDPYTLSWYQIRDPSDVQHTPPQALGTDLGGQPAVRGYSLMTWTYKYLKPEEWYALFRIFRLSRMAAGPHTGKVEIQWPDPESGVNQIASARWDQIDKAQRDFAQFLNVTLTFSHISIDDTTATGVWRLTE